MATIYNCVDAQSNARSVTTDVSGSTTLAFLALLFGAIGLIVVGALRNANRMKAQGIPIPSSPVLRFGGQEVPLADLKSSGYQHVATSQGKRSLADTLSQLQEARDKGLIDSDEYGRLRQEALDKLG
ncbi:MAG: SHOCT domain-containing protein [Chloroflexota bacterium]